MSSNFWPYFVIMSNRLDYVLNCGPLLFILQSLYDSLVQGKVTTEGIEDVVHD